MTTGQRGDGRDTGARLTPDALERARRAQALAYECVEAIGAELREGQTERDAAREMARWLRARGVREWFHQPFAWFGDRTAFHAWPAWTPLHFFPTRRRLHHDMPVILDVAPVVQGAAADVGYALWFGDTNPLHECMVADLEPYRSLVLDGVRAERTLREIYLEVDDLIADQGYRSAHRTYPFSVIAHRVPEREQDASPTIAPLRSIRVAGFGLAAQRFLLDEMAAAARGLAPSPLWNAKSYSDHRATPGLWAVEPHLSLRGVGVKWEELLVVTESDASWLDDDLPHVRRWTPAAEAAIDA